MKTHLFKARQILAIALIFSLLLPDAARAAEGGSPSRFPPKGSAVASAFAVQALQPLLSGGYRPEPVVIQAPIFVAQSAQKARSSKHHPFSTWSRFKRLVVAPLMMALTLFGQSPNSREEALTKEAVLKHMPMPAPKELPLTPDVARIMQEDETVANAPLDVDFWNQNPSSPEHIDQLADFLNVVINNSPEEAQQWLQMLSGVEKWIAFASRQAVVKYEPDRYRTERFNLAQNFGPAISDFAEYPTYQNRGFQKIESFSSAQELHGFSWLWGKVLDVALRGGIQVTPDRDLERNEYGLMMRSTQIHIDNEILVQTGLDQISETSRIVSELLQTLGKIRAKHLEIALNEKDRASNRQSGGEVAPEEATLEDTRLKNIGDDLKQQLTALEAARGRQVDALRRRLIASSAQMAAQKEVFPRPPRVEISRALIEALANLKLPGDEGPSTEQRLPADETLKPWILKRLEKLKAPASLVDRIKNNSPYHPIFLAALLNVAFHVDGYPTPVIVDDEATDPRREVVVEPAGATGNGKYLRLSDLLAVLPDDDSRLADSPGEELLVFQGRQLLTMNHILAQDKRSSLGVAIGLGLTASLPLRVALTGQQVLDPSATIHEQRANEILQRRIIYQLQQYGIRVVLPEWQSLRREQIEHLTRLRTEARAIIELFATLAQAENASLRNARNSDPAHRASVDTVTPAERIALLEQNLRTDLGAGLVPVLDRSALLTKAGQQKVRAAVADHVRAATVSIQALTPAVAPTAQTPTPTTPPAKKETPSKKKKLAVPHVIKISDSRAPPGRVAWKMAAGVFTLLLAAPAADAASLLTPYLHSAVSFAQQLSFLEPRYWTDPTLQIVTAVALGISILMRPYVSRTGPEEEPETGWRKYRVLPSQLMLAALLSLSLRREWLVGGAIAASTLVAALVLLPSMIRSYQKNSTFYRFIHYFSVATIRSRILQKIAGWWLILTAVWMLWPPVTWFVNRQFGLHSSESAAIVGKASTADIRLPIPIGAMAGEKGTVMNDPANSRRTTFKKGHWIVAWRGPHDSDTLKDLEEFNVELTKLGLTSIGHLDALSSARYDAAFVQVESNAERGSIDSSMDDLVREFREALNRTSRKLAQQELSGAGLTLVVRAHRITLQRLATILSTELSKRKWRDIPAKDDFSILPGTLGITFHAPLTNDSTLSLGTQVAANAAEFYFISNTAEALTLGKFQHEPEDVAIFRDPVSGIRYYFESKHIVRIEAPSSLKGYYANYVTEWNSGPAAEGRFMVEVTGDHLPKTHQVLDFEGFYRPGVLAHLDEETVPADFRMPDETLSNDGDKIAFVTMAPGAPVHPNYPGPQEALAAQIKEFQDSEAQLESIKTDASERYKRSEDTPAGIKYGGRWLAVIEETEANLAAIKRLRLAAEDRLKALQKEGVSTVHLNTGRYYSADPVAQAMYPLATPFSLPGAARDSYFKLGADGRLTAVVHGRDYATLMLRPEQHFDVRSPGTEKSFKVDYPAEPSVQERGFKNGANVIDGVVAPEELPNLFPQMNEGGAPLGLEPVHIHREESTQAPPARVKTKPTTPPRASLRFPFSDFLRLPKFLALTTRMSVVSLVAFGAFNWPALGALVFLLIGWILYRSGKMWGPARKNKWTGSLAKETARPEPVLSQILYGRNIRFRSRFEFPTLVGKVGKEEISSGTLETDRVLKALGLDWGDRRQKGRAGVALMDALDRFSDNSTIDAIATQLHLPSTRYQNTPWSEERLRDDVKKEFINRFEELGLVSVNTRPGEPLVDVAIYPDNRRILYVDADLLQEWLQGLSAAPKPKRKIDLTQAEQQRREAADALFLAVYYAAVMPKNLPEHPTDDRGPILDIQAGYDFLEHLDGLFRQVDARCQGAFTKSIEEARSRQPSHVTAYQIESSKRPLPGRDALQDYFKELTQKWLPPEWNDADGKPLSKRDWLANTYQDDGVTPEMARLLAQQDSVENKWRDLANRRPSFVFLEIFLWAVVVFAWIKLPSIIADVYNTLLAGNFSYAVLEQHSYLVALLVLAFFAGAFKAIVEPIPSGSYFLLWVRLARHGSRKNRQAEFKALTEQDASILLQHFNKKPTGNLQTFLSSTADFSRLIVKNVKDALELDGADDALKRRVVEALYAYAENPLHRRKNPKVPGPFDHLGDFDLPTEKTVIETVGAAAYFQPHELDWLFAEEQQELLQKVELDFGRALRRADFKAMRGEELLTALDSVRRHGFPFENNSPFKVYDYTKRRRRMESKRVKLAIAQMNNQPTLTLLALISRDLQTIAFDPDVMKKYENDGRADIMRKDIKAYVERLRTLSHGVYVSYRKWSRITPMGWQTHLVRSAVDSKNPSQLAEIEKQFSTALSGLEVDLTDPKVQDVLVAIGQMTPQQREKIRAFSTFLDPLSRKLPYAALWLKRILPGQLKMLRTFEDSQERLSLALLMLAGLPKTMRPLAIDKLKRLLDVRLSSLNPRTATLEDIEDLIGNRDFFIYRKLAEQSGLSLQEFVATYLDIRKSALDERLSEADANSRQLQLLGNFIDRLKLADGLRSGIIFMLSRRLLKNNPKGHATLTNFLTGDEDISEPYVYPSYMSEKFLQDENLTPTIPFAGLAQLEDESSTLLEYLAHLASKDGPLPLGSREIFQDLSLTTLARQALLDGQVDARLTSGDLNYVAISRGGSRSYLKQIFDRIAFRVKSRDIADRIHPVFYDQVERILHTESSERRIVLVSPELNGLQKFVDDKKLRDAIVMIVPSPFLTSAAKLLIFWTMLPTEKRMFLDDVRRRHGDKAVEELERKIEDLLFSINSFKLEFEVLGERYGIDKKGKTIDLLDKKRPPENYSTLVGYVTNGNDSHEKAEKTNSHREGRRFFNWKRFVSA